MKTIAKKRRAAHLEAGFALISAVVVLFVLLLLLLFLAALLLPALKTGYTFLDSTIARYQAEAGVARLLSTIRNTPSNLPSAPGENATLPLTVDEGFSHSDSVVVSAIGERLYEANVWGKGGGALRFSTVVFRSFPLPNATQAAVCVYGSTAAIIVGESFVSGNDHSLPLYFACREMGCAPTGFGNSMGIADSYTGGSQYNWLELLSYVRRNKIGTSTREVNSRFYPSITVIPSRENFVLDRDGAGLLLVDDGAKLFFDRGVHYEGFVVVFGSGMIIGNKDNHIYGSLVFVAPDESEIVFNDTKPNVFYSAAAIENIQKLNADMTKIISLR